MTWSWLSAASNPLKTTWLRTTSCQSEKQTGQHSPLCWQQAVVSACICVKLQHQKSSAIAGMINMIKIAYAKPHPCLSGFSFLPHFRPLTPRVGLLFPERYPAFDHPSFPLPFHPRSSQGLFQLQRQTDQRHKIHRKGNVLVSCPWRKSSSRPYLWSVLPRFWKAITRRYE